MMKAICVSHLRVCIFTALLALCIYTPPLAVEGKKPKSTAEWNKLLSEEVKDLDEKYMFEGDMREELMSEGQYEYERQEKRKKMAPEMPEDFDMGDPSAWMGGMQNKVGPTMMFASLNHTMPDGTKLTKELTQIKAAEWKEMLLLGGVEVTCYDIEWDKILVTLQRGWNGVLPSQ